MLMTVFQAHNQGPGYQSLPAWNFRDSPLFKATCAEPMTPPDPMAPGEKRKAVAIFIPRSHFAKKPWGNPPISWLTQLTFLWMSNDCNAFGLAMPESPNPRISSQTHGCFSAGPTLEEQATVKCWDGAKSTRTSAPQWLSRELIEKMDSHSPSKSSFLTSG